MGKPSHFAGAPLGGLMVSLRRLARQEKGQDLMEYSLLVSLIAIFTLAAMRLVATQITDTFWGQIANIDLF
jgi:Flp pilus assembly pilin Flp